MHWRLSCKCKLMSSLLMMMIVAVQLTPHGSSHGHKIDVTKKRRDRKNTQAKRKTKVYKKVEHNDIANPRRETKGEETI